MKPLGLILYRGPSLLDGSPIVVIATGFAARVNAKTGKMIQTYILRSDIDPISAVKSGADFGICGNCKLRGPTNDGKGRICYVKVFQGPLIVYKALLAGRYEEPADGIHASAEQVSKWFEGYTLRIGAYGDPAACPVSVWSTATRSASGHTGYTHQWRTNGALRPYVMASVDSHEEAMQAKLLGWRYFRVDLGLDMAPPVPIKSEVVCPASKEAGAKLTCSQCLACGGGNRKSSIVIKVHGNPVNMVNALRLSSTFVHVGV